MSKRRIKPITIDVGAHMFTMQIIKLSSYPLLAAALMLIALTTQSAPLPAGSLAPDWMLTDKNNQIVGLYQDTDAGNRVVMIFWASWCSICHTLLPKLDALKSKTQSNGIRSKFYALNVWEDGDPVAFFDSRSLSIDYLLKADNVAQRYGMKLVPSIVVIGSDRKIKYVSLPKSEPNDVIAEVAKALSK